MSSVERNEHPRESESAGGVSDSASRAGYSARMNYEAMRSAADLDLVDASARHAAGDDPLPASLYRTVKPGAWLAVLGAGLLGWALLLILF